MNGKTTLYCSFCGKSQHEVMCLIAGPTVFICDECVVLCQDIRFDHRVAKALELLQPAVRVALENPEAVLLLRDRLAASAMSGSAQDHEDGLGPKGASAAPEGGDARPSPPPSSKPSKE